MHGHLPSPHHLKAIPCDDDGSPFRQADAQQIRVLLDHWIEVIPPQARVDVLVDRAVLEVCESMLMVRFVRHDDVGAGRIAADEVVALNGCPGRDSADDPAAFKYY